MVRANPLFFYWVRIRSEANWLMSVALSIDHVLVHRRIASPYNSLLFSLSLSLLRFYCYLTFRAPGWGQRTHVGSSKGDEMSAGAMAELARLRAAKHAEYSRLSAEQKPQIQRCAVCGEEPYRVPVCHVSGLLHNLDQKRLIGGVLVDQECRSIHGQALMEAIGNTRVRWQANRTQLVRVESSIVKIFQSFAFSTGWGMQRYAILYGQYDASTKIITAEAVYEPRQHGNGFSFQALSATEDPQEWKEEQASERRANQLASALGMRRVGVLCSLPLRKAGSGTGSGSTGSGTALSSRELLRCAMEQSIYGDECVLLTIAPQQPQEHQDSPSAASAAMASCQCEAWQATSQCVSLFQSGLLSECSDFDRLRSDNLRTLVVEASVALEVTEEVRDPGSGRVGFQNLAPSKHVDTRWFTGCVGVEGLQSSQPRLTNLFMRRNRPGMPNPTPANVKTYLTDPKRASLPFISRVSDFQLLLYLQDALRLSDAAVKKYMLALVHDEPQGVGSFAVRSDAKQFEAEVTALISKA